MALPTKADLLLMGVSHLGKPFVDVEAKALNTVRLDVSHLGRPFVGAAGGVVATNYTLVCAAGSYSYTGVAATLTYVSGAPPVNYTLTCDAGSYTYTGVAATLTYVSGVAASRLKYWDGAAWQTKTLKYWDGGTWATKTLKYWDGGAWLS